MDYEKIRHKVNEIIAEARASRDWLNDAILKLDVLEADLQWWILTQPQDEEEGR